MFWVVRSFVWFQKRDNFWFPPGFGNLFCVCSTIEIECYWKKSICILIIINNLKLLLKCSESWKTKGVKRGLYIEVIVQFCISIVKITISSSSDNLIESIFKSSQTKIALPYLPWDFLITGGIPEIFGLLLYEAMSAMNTNTFNLKY